MIASVFCRVAVAVLVMQAAAASAQGLLPVMSTNANGVFFSASADYRSIQTPAYSLGAHGVDLATFGDAGALTTFKPRITGAAGQATLGMVLSPGSALATLGSNVRVALTGGYFSAEGTASGFSDDPFPAWLLLDGTTWFGCSCVSSQLTTKLSGWNAGLNAAGDVRHGHVLWTPSVELMLAGTRNKQSLIQSSPTDTYTATTKLNWNDAGVKFGLGLSMPVTPAVELNLGGTFAVLYRRVDLTGSDFLDIGGTDLTSAIAPEANTWTFVPGLQTQLTIRPANNMQVGIFGGVEWDTRTPRIISPTFADFPFGPGTAASIGFTTQTSYRFGGSFTYAFNR